MRERVVLFSLLVLIAVADITGCRRAGEWLIRDDDPVHGDAMVLLMGGISDRVLQAVDLYNEGKASRMIIVEESMGVYKKLEKRGVRIVSNTAQVVNAAVALGVPIDSINILQGDAESTMTEAMVVRDYLINDDKTDTIIIVTSPTHSRRASMIFTTAFRKKEMPVYVVSMPSKYSSFDSDYWWRRKEDIQKVLSEYVKIGSFILAEKKWLK